MEFNDAGLLSFVQAQANSVQREASLGATYGITYPQYIDIDSGGGPFVPGVTYVSIKQVGKAEYINGNADDVPLADATLSTKVMPVFNQGIGYGYGYIEAQQAQLYGMNLATERALSARRAYEQAIESIVFDGDSKHGLTGFKGISSSAANAGSNITKWVSGTATAVSMAQDLVTLVNLTGAGNQHTANRILLEEGQFTVADTTYFGNGSTTAIDYVQRKYPGLKVQGVKGLENSSSKALYIAYRKSPDVVSLLLPMPHRFLPVRERGSLGFVVPGIFRVGGVNFKRKQDIAFAAAA